MSNDYEIEINSQVVKYFTVFHYIDKIVVNVIIDLVNSQNRIFTMKWPQFFEYRYVYLLTIAGPAKDQGGVPGALHLKVMSMAI